MKEHQMDHWRRILAGLAPIELPTAVDRRPGAQVQSLGDTGRVFETVGFELSEDVAACFKRLADEWDAPVAAFPVAVFLVLLARYCGTEDVAVRVAGGAAGAASASTAIAAGVVLRTDLSGDPTFAQIVRRVQDAAAAAGEAGEVPFETLAEDLRDVADLDRLLVIDPQGSIRYSTELYDAAAIDRLQSLFAVLLEAVAAAPEAHSSEFELLAGTERQQVLVEWNDTAVAFPETVPVHRLVEERAAAQPDAVAIRSAEGDVTYGKLNTRANQLAHHLGAEGVGVGSMVAVCLDRSAELIVAMLGAVKAGAAYVPMDPGYPADRLAFMTEDCGAAVVVTDTAHAALFPAGTPVLLIDRDREMVAGQPVTDPDVAVDVSECCYVIYTSGSTGRPKGVAIEHRGVVNLVQWTVRSFGLEPGARVALCAGVGFDAFVWEVWPALAAGATCCVPAEAVRVSAPALRDWLLAQGIRGTFLSTPMLEAFAGLSWDGES
ncbi:MAG TPA: AMP-binding protein, partial [Actinocrinis sp.]|nr:AMP-binding protein [Actinocrinis sp.]